jgi:hypothetical protein
MGTKPLALDPQPLKEPGDLAVHTGTPCVTSAPWKGQLCPPGTPGLDNFEKIQDSPRLPVSLYKAT